MFFYSPQRYKLQSENQFILSTTSSFGRAPCLLRRSSLQLRVGLFVPAFFILFSGFFCRPSPEK
jgi:hypothetical protein